VARRVEADAARYVLAHAAGIAGGENRFGILVVLIAEDVQPILVLIDDFFALVITAGPPEDHVCAPSGSAAVPRCGVKEG
jgi:hypothetical protein